MTITRNFKLCLNAGTGSAPYINVNQYDSGEVWQFELYNENGTRYTPSTGAIIGLKADGHAIMNNGSVDSEGRVVITETEQMTAAAGRSVFELSIDGLTHGTANFIVKAERKPLDEGAMSDSDISMLQEVIDASEVINEIIGEGGDPSAMITDAVEDWLEAHPEATTTVQDGAITAPKINTTLWDKLLVSESASGAVASFDDGADGVPVKSLVAHINPVQSGSGDPSPTNIRPISGWTGVNVTNSGKNLIDVNSVALYDVTGNGVMRAGVKPVMLSAGKYTVSYTSKGASLGLYWTNITQNYAVTQITTNPQTFVLNSAAEILIRSSAGNVAEWNVVDLMVEHGNTATEYEGPTVYSVDWTSEAGTVYGGTVDLATGMLTVTHGIYTVSAVDPSAVKTGFICVRSANPTVAYVSNTNEKNAITNNMVFNYVGIIGFNGNPSVPFSFFVAENYTFFVLPTSVAPDSAAANTWFTNNPTTVVYPLATPTTVQLTPQEVTSLLGENNIFADTGNVDVIYRADTKLYIDKKIAEV